METRTSRSPDAGSILGLLGGVLLIIGSLLTWATVSVNVANIAGAFGVDPSAIPAGTFPPKQSFAGTSLSDGKIALVCGVIVLVAALLLIMGTARKVMAVILLLAGLAGGGTALYDGLNGKQNAIESGVKNLSALGLPGDVKSFFDVAIGIGIWVCVIGGIVGAVGAIIVAESQAFRSRGHAGDRTGGHGQRCNDRGQRSPGRRAGHDGHAFHTFHAVHAADAAHTAHGHARGRGRAPTA